MEEKQLFQKAKIQHIEISDEEKNFYEQRPSMIIKGKLLIYSFIFLFYTFFIISITYLILKKKNSATTEKLLKNTIKTEILKFLTNNDNELFTRVENCLEKDPDEELCLYQFLCPKEVINKTRVLMGYKGDGSYVMLDDFDNNTIAYSIGINKEIKFDKALADKGIDVFMYEYKIEHLPYKHEKFHWKKIRMGVNTEKTKNIQSLSDMIKDNGHLHEKNMILKIDVEGHEWNSLNALSEEVLKQFKYILVEYHFFKIDLQLFYNVLKKIHETHQVFYVHCSENSNIITFTNNRICETIEVSYVIRDGHSFATDKSIYPIPEFAYADHKGFNVNILKLFDNY